MAIYAQLSCEMPRDPRMLAAGWQARAVYVEAILYCRENLTDGLIDRRALLAWMPDMTVKTRARHLDRLAELGALVQVEEGWRFPADVWSRWNPTRADVEAMREAKREAGIRGNHERWHVGPEGKPSNDCPLCSQTDRTDIAGCDRSGNRIGSPEPEPEKTPTPSTSLQEHTPSPVDK